MQLDRTSIAIRERSYLDLLDLSLRVLAHYARPLLYCWLAATVPLMLVNFWLASWMSTDFDDALTTTRYINTLIMLVLLQAPLVSIFITSFLGRAVFMNDPTRRGVLGDVRQSISPLVWCVMILRAAALSWVLIYLARSSNRASGWDFLLMLITAIVVLVRAARPYLMEIILLERNPVRSKMEGEMTIGQRSRNLHSPNTGDLMGRWFASVCISIALCASIVLTAWFISGMVFMQWTWGPLMIHFIVPASLWTVAGFMAIVRFLSYMDLRIRNEGWETELLLRAAAEPLLERLR